MHSVQKMRDFLALSILNGMFLSNSSSSRFRDLCRREVGRIEGPEMVSDFKKTVPSRHNRIIVHMNPESVAARTGPAQAGVLELRGKADTRPTV